MNYKDHEFDAEVLLSSFTLGDINLLCHYFITQLFYWFLHFIISFMWFLYLLSLLHLTQLYLCEFLCYLSKIDLCCTITKVLKMPRNSFGPCIKNIIHLCILPFVTSILLAEDVYGKFLWFYLIHFCTADWILSKYKIFE